MITRLLLICLLTATSAAQTPWRLALPGWEYAFPRDHLQHDEFKTEWWYFTGNVATADGERFGYQLTFFRQGIRPPSARTGTTSRFVVDDLKFAHFAVSDPQSGKFRSFQRTSRGAFGEAGFGDSRVWIDVWSLTMRDAWTIEARDGDVAISLELRPAKSWIVHGENGVSQKAAGDGHASHYYSGTRLNTRGRINGQAVEGTSWFDHEWATNQLTPEQIGWNWFSIHFDDNTELMLYQMRLRDGGIDPNSSGTFIAADGTTQHLRRDDYRLTPLRWWTSKATGGRYPIAWRVEIPRLRLTAEVTTPIDAQELVMGPIKYWEGMIDVRGERDGHNFRGNGYLELTGYAGAIVGLSQ
ncbi:MAG: lipocalin-like domain-containing protein [Chthoniobacteraceae bacterium]